MGFSLLISSSAWSIDTPWRISTLFHWIMPLSIARFRTDSTFFALTIATLLCSVEMIGPAAVYHMNSPWGGLSGN